MSSAPLAIVGMACRFPHGEDEWEYWDLLRRGGSGIEEIPADRWDWRTFYEPRMGEKGKMCTRWGGFLRDIDGFDADLFGVPSHEAARMDPQQRLTMEVAWEAIEDAGIFPPSLAGSQTGVVLGIAHGDHNRLHYRDLLTIDAFNGTNTYLCVAANRLSFSLDLRGPSLAVDTACSSSLYALYLARLILDARHADCVLVGAANLNLSPEEFISLSHAGLMARDGRCKTFDAAADGYVRGEGCGFLVLRRLEDAERLGTRIRGTILGICACTNGRTNGLTAPRGEAQQELLLRTWQDAGINAGQLGMIEAHGSGTLIGDRIEAQAIARAAAQSGEHAARVSIGTAKTNIGHLEAAAGMAGLVKILLSMEHGSIPPHQNLTTLAPGLPASVRMLGRLEDWPSSATAGAVSAFGFGGAIAHAVVGRFSARPCAATSTGPTAFMLSARTKAALHDLGVRLREHLQACEAARPVDPAASRAPVSPRSLARTLAASRAGHCERLAVICGSVESLCRALSLETDQPGDALVIRGSRGRRAPKLAVWNNDELARWLKRLGVVSDAIVSAGASITAFFTLIEETKADGRWVLLAPAICLPEATLARARQLEVHVLCASGVATYSDALLITAMQYWALGGDAHWDRMYEANSLVSLPGYPFQRERYAREPYTLSRVAANPAHQRSDADQSDSDQLTRELVAILDRFTGGQIEIEMNRSLREHGLEPLALMSLRADVAVRYGAGCDAILDPDVPLSELAHRIAARVRADNLPSTKP